MLHNTFSSSWHFFLGLLECTITPIDLPLSKKDNDRGWMYCGTTITFSNISKCTTSDFVAIWTQYPAQAHKTRSREWLVWWSGSCLHNELGWLALTIIYGLDIMRWLQGPWTTSAGWYNSLLCFMGHICQEDYITIGEIHCRFFWVLWLTLSKQITLSIVLTVWEPSSKSFLSVKR